MLRKLVYQSELGEIVVLANEKGLLGCYFLGQKYFEYGYEREKIIEETTIFLDEAKVWLDDYFAGKNPDPSRLNLVPYGLGNQGQLTGYAGGVERKCWLLEHEKANF